MRHIRHLPLLLLVLISVSACAINPVTGKRELHLISQAQEIAIGTKNYAFTRQSQGGDLTVDPALSAYVSSIGQRLAQVSDRPDLPYEFVVLNNSVPNAWALPGGKIAVNRGLLTELGSEAELAAVLGHEIVHAAARHGARSMERGMLLQAGVMAATVSMGGKKNSDMIVGSARMGSQLISRRYGRNHELESDLHGMRYMAKAGYDPSAAVDLQRTFLRLSQGRRSSWLDGLFASHPPSRERVQRNQETATQLLADYPRGQMGKASYRLKITTLTHHQTAYEDLDKGLAALRKGRSGEALRLAKQAQRAFAAEPAFYTLESEALLAQKRYRDAATATERAFRYGGKGYVRNYLLRGKARQQLGDQRGARADFDRSLKLLPTAGAHIGLATLDQATGAIDAAKKHLMAAAQAPGEEGKTAQLSLARLILADEPERYISAKATRQADGTVVVEILNRAPISVQGVTVQVGNDRSSSAVISTTRVSFPGPIPAGKGARLAARIPVVVADDSNAVTARVITAQPAEASATPAPARRPARNRRSPY